jgi:hypothetical protein
MTTFLRRHRRRPARYVLISRTNHWQVRGSELFRDCVVFDRVAGVERVIGVRDDLRVAA